MVCLSFAPVIWLPPPSATLMMSMAPASYIINLIPRQKKKSVSKILMSPATMWPVQSWTETCKNHLGAPVEGIATYWELHVSEPC